MKQLYQLILLLFAYSSSILAQEKIVAYEYWLNNDYTSKQATQITPVQTFNWQTTIPCQNLDVGLHTLNVRFKDNNGHWSSTVSSYFYKTEELLADNKIVQLEYWLNGDYSGKKMVQPSVANTVQWQIDIPFQELEEGIHTFNVRFKDTKGYWSSTVSSYFFKVAGEKSDNTIIAYEYWLDGESGKRKTVNTSNAVFNLSTAITSDELAPGIHSFHIRFKDKYGKWSSTESRYFQKIPDLSGNLLVAYEYWMNDHYEEKFSGTIDNKQTFVILDDFDVTKATKATNYIHLRFKDAVGQWSSVISQDFYRPVEPNFNHIAGLSDVAFTNTSKYADKYRWDFGDGNTSTQVNPLHTYAEPGAYPVWLFAENKEFKDSILHYVEIEGIKKISNNRGGNSGLASFDIYGGGLDANTVVKLVKNGETISTHAVYQREPGIICATFDLTGKNVGVYDIVITINGKDYVTTDGFTIEEAGWVEAWAELEGSDAFIPGRWQTYTVNYGNVGNTDIYGLPINIIFGDLAEVEFLFDLIDVIDGESTDINDSNNYIKLSSLYETAFNGKMYSLLIPHIPANTSGSFSFRAMISAATPTHIFVNTGEVLNDIYFNVQEDEYGTDIFGYELTNNFHVKKEELSQLIRNEINKSFQNSQATAKKRFVNFAKLLNNSNCFLTSLRSATQSNDDPPPLNGPVCIPGKPCSDECSIGGVTLTASWQPNGHNIRITRSSTNINPKFKVNYEVDYFDKDGNHTGTYNGEEVSCFSYIDYRISLNKGYGSSWKVNYIIIECISDKCN